MKQGHQINGTLYVSDLDGTLLTPEHTISPYSLEVINSLIDQGVLFTFATARSLASALPVTQGLNIKMPVIVYNGVFIMDLSSGEKLFSNYFTTSQTYTLKDIFTKIGISPMVYSFHTGIEKVTWRQSYENDGIRHYLTNRKGDKRLHPLSDQEDIYKGDIFTFVCIGTREELFPVYEILKDHPEYHCYFQQELYRQEYWCEIIPKTAGKANALLHLKSILGVKKVVSFGDAVNDIPLFAVSDECYAVSNAVDSLKQKSTGIIGGNNNDGVARWLLSNALKGD